MMNPTSDIFISTRQKFFAGVLLQANLRGCAARIAPRAALLLPGSTQKVSSGVS
jgi:hypothetical protein